MHNGDREFSKRLVRWTFAAFWIQVFIGLAFALVRPDVTAW